jgi:hypothetical protein
MYRTQITFADNSDKNFTGISSVIIDLEADNPAQAALFAQALIKPVWPAEPEQTLIQQRSSVDRA